MHLVDREEFRNDANDQEDDHKKDVEFNVAEPEFLKGFTSKAKNTFVPVQITQDPSGPMS